MTELFKALCALEGVSGREGPVREFIRQRFSGLPHVVSMEEDPLGNLLLKLRGERRAARSLMLSAHMDEVGMIACGYTDDGFVRVAPVGGIDPSALFGHRVRFGKCEGTIGGKAIHLCQGDEKEAIPKEDLLVDIGADNPQEAQTMVAIGSTAVWSSDFTSLGKLVKGRAIDDRAGCALLTELAAEVPPVDFSIAFTVQEEVGLRGAKAAAFTLAPEVAVAVEATTAADTAGTQENRQVCAVGKGPVVSFMDRRTLYDPSLYALILKTAGQNGIPAQTKSMVAGGNDAGSFQTSGAGAKVAAVSLPCRYIHSPACVLSMEDMRHTLALLKAVLLPLAMGETA